MAGTQRYVRYILIAFLCLILVWFISSSPDPRGRLQSAGDYIKSHGSMTLKQPSDSSEPGSDSVAEAAAGSLKESLEEAVDDTSNDDAADEPLPDFAKPVGSAASSAAAKSSPGAALSDSSPKSSSPMASMSPKLPSDLPPATAPGERMNATFVTLARNSDVWEIAESIRQVEDRFNRKFNYDWVFLNDNEFNEEFKAVTTALVSGRTRYGTIPKEHWSFPDWIDQDRAKKVREEMKEKNIIYGDSVSYRHMCRYESGFFFRHPLMLEYEWYWRVEPSIKLYCDINYDTFKFMAENKKKYSFVISLYEYVETIETLWDSVKGFMKEFPQHITDGNSLKWVSDDGGNTYNHCHFWSNFEIGNLNWLRSQAYLDYFNKLDHDGGFFYERWGDAPVHSIAAALMLKKEEIHFFNDISYWHVPFTHCPTGEQFRMENKCHCNPKENFDWNGYSCTKRFYEVNSMDLPKGWGEGN